MPRSRVCTLSGQGRWLERSRRISTPDMGVVGRVGFAMEMMVMLAIWYYYFWISEDSVGQEVNAVINPFPLFNKSRYVKRTPLTYAR